MDRGGQVTFKVPSIRTKEGTMKKIIVEGCGGCPYKMRPIHSRKHFCSYTAEDLDDAWRNNPKYIHPDCPLEHDESGIIVDQIHS